MSGLLDGLRSFYFSLEDKYYSVLDRIQKKVPVYSIVDPIDKIIPSFILVVALFALVLAVVGMAFLGGAGGAQGSTVALTVSFTDASGAPLSGVVVTLTSLSDVPDSVDKVTDDSGEVEFNIVPGDFTLSASADGFDDFTQDITVNASKQLQFQLSPKAPPVKSRALIIVDDSGSVLGSLAPVTISLSFACQSGSPPADQTVFKGNVNVLQPSSCVGLAVTVTVSGFVTKSQPILGDTTTIQLQSEETVDIPVTPTKGSVEIVVKDKDNKPVPGVQVKLYKSSTASDVLASQSLTDTGGFAVLDDVLPGKYKLTATKQGFKIYTSSEFQVNAGEKNSLNAKLELSSTSKKFFVKVLSSEDQTPVIGATVILFLQANGGKYIEDGTYTTDVNGVVNQPVGDFNSGVQVVVTHSSYVTEIVSNQGIMLADDSTPIPVLIEPVEPKGTNGNTPNALTVDVKVIDLLGFAVNNADTILYTPDMNGVFIAKKKTNVSGIARYENLPSGMYQAKASTSATDGNSLKVTGNVNTTIVLPVTVDNGTALVEVTVKDSFNKPLADVNVGVYQSSSSSLLTQAVTNAAGVATLSVKTVDLAYVKTTKNTYIPFYSTPFGVIKDNIHKINAEMALASATPALDVELISIYELSSTGTKTLASALVPGATYEFHFSVKAPTDQENIRALVRVNAKNATALQPTDVASITGGKTAKGGLLFFNQTNVGDEFTPPVASAVSSVGPAKVMINGMGGASAGAYELVSLVTINPNAFPGTDKLELAYQTKSDTTLSALHVENYTIGNPLPPQGDFGYLFFISLTGSNQKTQVSSALPVKIEANKEYTLDYLISNASGVNFPSATMGFSFPSGTVVPASVTLPGFNSSQSVGGSVKVKATVPCTACGSITATLNLGAAAAGKSPLSYTINTQVTPEKEISLKATPTFLIPGLTQTVSVVAVDNDGNPLNASNLVQVTGKLKGKNTPVTFTGSPQGVFIASIHKDDAVEGEIVEIKGEAPGYLSDMLSVPISTSGIGNFSQDFGCVTFPSSLAYTPPSQGSLKIDTENCFESVQLYMTGDGPVGLTAKFGNKILDSPAENHNLLMGATDSKTITLSSPSPAGSFGLFPVVVYAKFAGQPNEKYVPIKTVDVQVNPNDGASHCLNIDNAYVVDLSDGSDSAEVVNKCNPLVKDAFLPSASLNLPGVFVHALPSVNTPDLQSGASIPFQWQVKVDYSFTNSDKVVLDDYPANPPVDDAKWNRYMKMSDTFLKTFGDFSDVTPELITDMVVNTTGNDSGTAFLEHSGPDYPFYHKNTGTEKKSILYSTTFIVDQKTKFQQICVTVANIENVIVRVDGKTIHSGAIDNCDNLDAGAKNVTLDAGPHQLNIYAFDSGTQNYWVRVRIQVAGNFSKLSGPFDTNPLYGAPFTPEDTFSGTLYYPLAGPKSDSFSLANKGTPVKLSDGTVVNAEGNPIRNVLTNATGGEQLKQARIQTYSSDPRIRVFVKDDDVYAQYVGFDDPSLKQNIVFENTGAQDTRYAVLSLSDYTAVDPTNKKLTVAVLLDGSSSVLLNEADLGQPPVWNGLCSYLNNLEKGMEYYSGAAVTFKLFVLNTPSSFTGTPCGATVLSVPLPGGFDPATQNANEFWGEGVKTLAADTALWDNASNKLLIVVTDTKATGSAGNYTQYNDAIDSQLASDAGTLLGDSGIRGVVLYKTPIESTAVVSGTDPTNKAIQSYSTFSARTISPTAPVSMGFVEALDYSEFILNASTAYSSVVPFEHAQNNKVVQRLVQFAFPVKEEKIVVKVIAPPMNACVSENGDIGTTGNVNRPKILLNWEWDDQSGVNTFLCDAKSGENAGDFAYCDATQFTITLIKKLEMLRQALGASATPEQIAQIPFLTTFDAYLIRDSYTNDFRSDFVSLNTQTSFLSPSFFKGGSGSDAAWKDYLSSPSILLLRLNTDSPNSLTPLTLPYSGLYRVQISYTTPTFFVSGSPSSIITVTFTPLANAKGLSNYSELYELPFDGAVGLETAGSSSVSPYVLGRDGYGVGFTGSTDVRISDDTGFAELKTYPAKANTTPFVSVAVSRITDFVGLNTGSSRGVGVEYNKTAGTLVFHAGVPSPALAEWSSSSLGKGELFYSIHENIPGTNGSYISYNTANGPLAKWVPVASLNSLTTSDCETCNICLDAGNNPYELSTMADHNPTAGQCVNYNTQLNAGNTFGFSSTSGTSNTAYLGTTFYTYPGDGALFPEYHVWMSCNPASTGVPKGRIATVDGVASQGQEAQLGMVSSDIAKFSQTLSMEEILNLISNPSSETAEGWVCASSKNNTARVYWNDERIRDELFNLKADSTFGTLSNQNKCEAVGTPLFSGDFWTLTQEIQSITPPAIATKFCPLYNDLPSAGQYKQVGIPYPAGTQVYIPGDGTPVTGDPVNSAVQYRYDPTGCSGTGSTNCGGGPNKVCTSNSVLVWKN